MRHETYKYIMLHFLLRTLKITGSALSTRLCLLVFVSSFHSFTTSLLELKVQGSSLTDCDLKPLILDWRRYQSIS